MNLELYKISKDLEKDFNNKYGVNSLKLTSDDDDFNDITIEIKNTEVKANNINMLKLIDELVFELNKKGLNYKQGFTNTSNMQISDVIPGEDITNETTVNIYHIKRV